MAERSSEAEHPQAPNSTPSPKDPSAERESKATVWSAVFAGFSLLALVASIIIGYSATKLAEQQTKLAGQQTELTGQQNTNAQQQELVTLVTDITQAQQGSSTDNVNGISSELTQLGEAEEADTIINSLPPSDVTSVEEYVVGTGLEDGEDYQPALRLVMESAKAASDPRTTADAWRAAAYINYQLGFNSRAEYDIHQARRSFGQPDVLEFEKESNIAYTDLFDIYYQARIVGCSTAVNEWNEAIGLIKKNQNLLSGPSATAAEKNARNALADTCRVPLAALEKEVPIPN
jgi:hypothetical protein